MNGRPSVDPPQGYSRPRRDILVARYRSGALSLSEAQDLNSFLQFERRTADANGTGYMSLVLLADAVQALVNIMSRAASARA